VLIAETGPVTDRLRVREIDDDEGQRLVRIIRRGIGSVVTWRRAQMVLLSAQGMDVPAIAKVAFTSEDRVRDVIRNFSADGFGSLYPKHKGGRPPKFTLPQRREIKKIAKAKPAEYDPPFSTWSLAKLADFLVAEGVDRRHQPRGPAHAAPRNAGNPLGALRRTADERRATGRPLVRAHAIVCAAVSQGDNGHGIDGKTGGGVVLGRRCGGRLAGWTEKTWVIPRGCLQRKRRPCPTSRSSCGLCTS
jgi:transposase